MVLGQIVDSIDAGLLYAPNWDYHRKSEMMIQRLIDSFKKYPTDVSEIMKDSVEILHGIRDDKDSSFHCMQLKWTRRDNKWHINELPIEKFSYQIRISGSGAKEFVSRYESYKTKPDFKTSRAVYQTFCDTLKGIKEKSVGGAPQLVGLYRKKGSPACVFGIIHENQRFFGGMHIDNYPSAGLNNVEWRNEMFERYEGGNMTIIEEAQKQPHI